MGDAFRRYLAAEHPELDWEPVSETELSPNDQDPVSDRGSLAA